MKAIVKQKAWVKPNVCSLFQNSNYGFKLAQLKQAQHGTVLVLVLLIVAIVSALSVKYVADYQLGLARAETRWHGTQARAFLEGTEEVAKLLFPTADIDQNSDYAGEPWGNEIPIDDQGVTGTARLTDSTVQLNINDLAVAFVNEKQQGDPQRYSETQRCFIRLLQTFPDVPLSETEAENYLEALIDWLDPDNNESGSGGAEENYYRTLKPAYAPANQTMKSMDELRLVRGFNENPKLVLLLTPFLTVLPTDQGATGINVNTIEGLSPWGGKSVNNLLRCINDATTLSPNDASQAKNIITSRPEIGYGSKDDVKKIVGTNADTGFLQTNTKLFWLNSSVQLVDQRRSTRTLMQRTQTPSGARGLKVVKREDVYELPSLVQLERERNKEKEDGLDLIN
jgi:general secretion pathway protein K